MSDHPSFSLAGNAVTLGGPASNAAIADNGAILVLSSEVVTYSGTTYRSGQLVAQLYDHAGQPVGDKVAVASRSLYYSSESGPGASDVDALTGGGFVTAFHASPQSGSPGSEVWIAVFSPGGALLRTMQLGSAYGGSDISVDPLGNGGFVVAATSAGKYDYGRSYVQTFDASGAPTSESLQLGTAADVLVTGVGESGYLAAYGKLRYFDGASFKEEVTLPAGVLVAAGDTLTTGKVVLLSTRYDGTEYDLYSLTFDPATNALTAPTLIHSEAKAMSALTVEATPGGGYVVSWSAETYTNGGRAAFAVGPSGAKSDLFTFEGTLLGAFGPTDSVVSTLSLNATPKLQDYAVGAGEAPAQTLRADNSAGQRLTGGSGDDIIHAGQNSTVLTGQGGGDLFVFDALPWNAGRITDFTVGADKLDFFKLFSAAGYAGSDPVADGRVFFQSDAAGTRVYLDGDGSGSAQSPFLITLLEGVAGALAWAKIGGVSAGGPPPSPPPSSQIGLTNVEVNQWEGNAGLTPFVYSLSRTGDTNGTASVTWSVSPWTNTLTAEDFENGVYPSGTVTFAPGETVKQIVVNVRSDTAAEHDEQFNLNLTGVTGATLGISNAKGHILDEDVYQPPTSQFNFTSQSVAQAEGNSGLTPFTFTVTRSGSANVTATVDWTVSGQGSNPATAPDFQGGVLPSGTLTFAVGEASKTVTVQVAGDTVLENNEAFEVRLSNPVGAALGSQNSSYGTINNDDSPPSDGGRIINSPGPGSTLNGGAGNDTLNASQGPDVLTGGGGGDVFRWAFEPWAPARVTDFAIGSDVIDLSNLFRLYGYTGSDPVADKWVWLIDDGAGGTKLLFDRDGTGGDPQWPNYILQLEKVSVSGLTWSKLTTGGGGEPPPPPPPPPPGDGQVITSPGPGSTLTGGAGADTLISSRGQDVLTGAGG
uniref:Calx-beta domain-containing protein n=1 Tax=Phenylobacterium sp. TaxID=1871053 RepID=UPI002811DC4C